ncbi:hypothetical protein HPB47_003810 [Ixodes persulcatus]|uniref:Uncharacterized protein n=1 Tax=Ixodes persulcatus TaxID=34615 RepID=A0AC60PHF4_IXOPE|nr:hypothetical protein HPB47_003810 [Ixodes persulcatus]
MVREARVRDVAGMLAPQIQAVALEIQTTLLDCSGTSAQKMRGERRKCFEVVTSLVLSGRISREPPNQLCFQEATSPRHLFLCGKTTSSEDKVSIFALCLATSSVRGDPHEINVELVAGADSCKFKVERAICSCVAGTSECCKHTVAALLHCNRTGIHRLEELSSTDRECTWKKTPGQALYGEPLQLKAFCHVKTLPAPLELAPEEEADTLKQLMGACFNSALAKHR